LQKDGASALPVIDYKSALQEIVHASGRPQPRYSLVKEQGPEHRKLFTMEVHVPAPFNGGEAFVSRSEAGTKKRAEQGAARQAYEYLQSLQANAVRKSPSEETETTTQS
jgi:ribonuclease-3